MSRSRILLASAAALLLLIGVVFVARVALRTPCDEIGSWDECERASHCSPVRFVVSDEHSGPAWECDDG